MAQNQITGSSQIHFSGNPRYRDGTELNAHVAGPQLISTENVKVRTKNHIRKSDLKIFRKCDSVIRSDTFAHIILSYQTKKVSFRLIIKMIMKRLKWTESATGPHI